MHLAAQRKVSIEYITSGTSLYPDLAKSIRRQKSVKPLWPDEVFIIANLFSVVCLCGVSTHVHHTPASRLAVFTQQIRAEDDHEAVGDDHMAMGKGGHKR